MTNRDGGPAFPQNDLRSYGMGPSEFGNGGMTLRDWFAGQALVGMAAMTTQAMHAEGYSVQDVKAAIVRQAYGLADAIPAAQITVQCCMCGKTGLSTVEDGGAECELNDGRWVCSAECYDRALPATASTAVDLRPIREALEWYTDARNYETNYTTRPCGCCADSFVPINGDKGEKARAALALIDGEKHHD